MLGALVAGYVTVTTMEVPFRAEVMVISLLPGLMGLMHSPAPRCSMSSRGWSTNRWS